MKLSDEQKTNLVGQFMANDLHSREMVAIFDAFCLAFEKLAPALTKETKGRVGYVILGVRDDLARYLGRHIEQSAKEASKAKAN